MPYLTKDNARLFYLLLKENKYELLTGTKEQQLSQVQALNNLEEQLKCCIYDKRRTGRTSQDTSSDLVKRIITKYS